MGNANGKLDVVVQQYGLFVYVVKANRSLGVRCAIGVYQITGRAMAPAACAKIKRCIRDVLPLVMSFL